MSKVDKTTKRWIRNASDELAVANGCRFDEKRAMHFIESGPQHLRLYEGDCAGQPLVAHDWQFEIGMRLFGWVKRSDFWKREVRRFRRASIWVPKKNKKSPTIAWIGIYLWALDGEQGQKVFSAAKDGKQAEIIHMHAKMMVETSPTLSRQAKINKTTGRITHLPTNSFYDLLAGDNIEGKEGINGSVMIDETHVVDERLARRIKYAGISRSEPLQVEVSTAGNNPEGYGRKQYDLGKKIESGEVVNEQLFFAAYEAPQNATDEQCSDPEIWKQANPAWGHTVNEEEFRAEFEAARHTLSDWNDFKLYRLNIWQTSESPWLRIDDWRACFEGFSAESLKGRKCWAALDLSKTKDTTSLVLAFPDADEVVRILPFFWLPEATLRDRTAPRSYIDWNGEGFLETTPGDTLDYKFVKRRIEELKKIFRIQELVYDPTYADYFAQEIENELGIERVEFRQTMQNFADPTSEFERRVIDGKIRHNDHPVMTWQIGNVAVKSDENGYRRPVKPKPNDRRKIDGPVAAIMALGRVMVGGHKASVYEERGVRRL